MSDIKNIWLLKRRNLLNDSKNTKIISRNSGLVKTARVCAVCGKKLSAYVNGSWKANVRYYQCANELMRYSLCYNTSECYLRYKERVTS